MGPCLGPGRALTESPRLGRRRGARSSQPACVYRVALRCWPEFKTVYSKNKAKTKTVGMHRRLLWCCRGKVFTRRKQTPLRIPTQSAVQLLQSAPLSTGLRRPRGGSSCLGSPQRRQSTRKQIVRHNDDVLPTASWSSQRYVLWRTIYSVMESGRGRYGLIMPKKLPQKNLVSKKLSVFADDSDEEPSVGESLQKEALKKQAMKQTKLEIQKALEEDATVYEYDSIYDEMQQKKKESNARVLSGKDDKKPRYIQNILKAAEIRKKEQEKRMERKIQKEREMEGGEFAHKEAFVTSAYKKKLQERAEEEERERREAALEAYLDVTKQKDLSGFYRHLLNQRVGEEEMPKCSFREARIKEEKSDSCYDESNQRNKCPSERQRVKPSAKKENNPDADTDLGTDSSDDDKRHKNSKVNLKKKKRRESSVSSEEEPKRPKSQRHSRSPSSSSVEEELRTKAQTNDLTKRGESRPSRRGNDEQYREKDYERSRTHEKDHQREKEERHRYGDHTNKDSYRRREEQDDKQRGKERKEREGHGREWRKAKERDEKGSEKEREKERIRNGKDRYSDRGKERGEKCREKEDHVKERREKYGSDEKKYRERREGTPTSLEKDGETDLEKERKGKEREVDEKGRSSSGILYEQKRKAGEEGEKEEKEQVQKPSESMSKFAKRSNEETVMSARDRYLARQMARVSTKSYIEKEED